jgi:hypothetical protein
MDPGDSSQHDRTPHASLNSSDVHDSYGLGEEGQFQLPAMQYILKSNNGIAGVEDAQGQATISTAYGMEGSLFVRSYNAQDGRPLGQSIAAGMMPPPRPPTPTPIPKPTPSTLRTWSRAPRVGSAASITTATEQESIASESRTLSTPAAYLNVLPVAAVDLTTVLRNARDFQAVPRWTPTCDESDIPTSDVEKWGHAAYLFDCMTDFSAILDKPSADTANPVIFGQASVNELRAAAVRIVVSRLRARMYFEKLTGNRMPWSLCTRKAGSLEVASTRQSDPQASSCITNVT